ncbi:MAG: hypothetical protein DRP08_07725, partial [Candidatus Aenigmatarchaeota archaeon]
GGDILNQELRTNFRTDAGGISRNAPIDVGQRISFSFDFHSDVGGWAIQINTVEPQHWNVDSHDRLAFLIQHSVGGNVRYKVGANLHDIWAISSDARSSSDTVHISGVIEADLSAIVNVDYNDGGPIATFNFVSPGIDPSTIPQGTLLSIGNSNDGVGNSYFDNYVVTAIPEPCTLALMTIAIPLLIKRKS